MVIFIYGPDTYRSQEKLNELINKFKEKRDLKGLSVVKLEGKDLTIDEFRKAVLPAGLFSTKRLIIIENLLSEAKNENLIKEITNSLKKKLEKENVVIFYEREEINRGGSQRELFNLLKKQKYVYEFNLLEGVTLKNWIIREVKKMAGQISKEAVEYFTLHFDADLWEIKNELDKAFSYGKGKIDLEILNLISEKGGEENIFALIDALIAKNKKRAVELLDQELNKGTLFTKITERLAYQFRIILYAKEAKNNNFYQIARELGVHHFPVKKAIEQAKKYQSAELKKIYQELLKIDLQLKTTRLEPELLFDLLVAKL